VKNNGQDGKEDRRGMNEDGRNHKVERKKGRKVQDIENWIGDRWGIPFPGDLVYLKVVFRRPT